MKRLFPLFLAVLMSVSLLVGCTAAQNEPAVSPDGGATPVSPDASGADEPQSAGIRYEDTIAWDAEYDVVVIGFGGAGANASMAAAEEGASVLLTEKAPEGHEGGNTRYCAQVILNYMDYDSGMAYVEKANEGYDTATPEILDFIVRGSMENPEWLKSLGLSEMTMDYALGEYPEFPGADHAVIFTVKNPEVTSGKTYWETVRQGVVDRADSITVWFESPAKHLIQDPFTKTVIGVQIERGGKLLNVRAKNGVVLSCGGFENNEEMVENYTQRERMYPLGSTYNTGDGIHMAVEVGADLWHMNALSGPWITIKTDDMDRAYFGGMTQNLAKNNASIYVGPSGARFMAESGWQRHGHTHYAGNYYSQLTPYPMYMIFDESAREAGLVAPSQFSADLSAEIASGTIIQADTIAELAEKIGVNVDQPTPNVIQPLAPGWDDTYRLQGLVNQVELYNRYCKDGKDLQFDRRSETLVPIEKAPFYALEIQPAMVNTQGGAKRNIECEVLDTEGNPIPHLYSAGEFGSFYAGAYTGGGNLAETMFTGRTAGRNAAKPKDALPAVKLDAVTSNLQTFESDLGKGAGDIAVGNNEYLGTANGIGGEVIVKVTMDSSNITAVEVVKHAETAGISDPAIERIPAAIVAANSAEGIDTVSGATITSKAIIAAVQDAMSKIN